MKKLTLVLVALLLALACVFAACGKKNDTPADTDPKPVDDNPAPVVEPTVAKEDLLKIAEALKAAYVENYVGLYSDSVANAIEAEKSAALLNITGASSKEEAQKIADNFIAFLKAQKTTVDELKDLIAKIGDVALADEDAIKEAAAYVDALSKAYAGANDAKKAVLDAFKADKTTKETVQKMEARLAVLLKVKEDADDKDNDGINNGVDKDDKVETIAELKALFTGEKYEFTMKSYDAYEKIVAAVEAIAKDNDIAADSDAYAEIFDVATLAEMKALLDAAIAAKPAMTDLKAIIDAAEALKVTAEDARYKEYAWTYDSTKVVIGKKATKDAAIEAAKAECKTAEVDFDEAKIIEVEADSTDPDGTGDYKGLYKLALKADIEAAEDLITKLNKKYTTKELANAGLVADGEADNAIKAIGEVRDAYDASVEKAETRFNKYLGAAAKTSFVTATPKKDATVATYTGFETAAKNYNVATTAPGTKLGDEIAKIVGTFKTKNASGYEVGHKVGYINEGAYGLKAEDKATYKFDLIDGTAAIKYTAWTYSYEFDGKTPVVSKDYAELTPAEKEKAISVDVFDVLAELDKDAKVEEKYAKAEDALKWLVIFIGEGEYEEKYELTKDYGFAQVDAKDVVLYMTDRDVKEVAKAGVTKIDGKATAVAADAATEIKVLSSYTVAKAVVEAAKEIKAAQDAAVEELKAATLALRKTGDANAIVDAKALYDAIKDGSYVNKKLNGEAAADENNAYYAVKEADMKAIKVVVKEATEDKDAEEVKVIDMLNDAYAVQYVETAKDSGVFVPRLVSFSTITDAAAALKEKKDDFAENEAMVLAFAKIVAKAAAEVDRCQAAYDLTTTDSARIVDKDALAAAKLAAEKLDTLSDLLVDQKAFAAADEDHVILKETAEAADIWKLIKDFTAYGEVDYDGLDAGKADQKALSDLCAYMIAIYKGTGDDQAALKTLVDEAEKTLVKAFADFKLDYTVAEKVDAEKVSAFFEKLDAFAKEYNADYLNLTVSYTYGDNTVTVDLFTEAYRQLALGKVFGQIAKIKAAAATATMAGKDVLDDNWQTLVTANVNETEVKFDAQTSIADAEELVKAYELSDATYKLDTVLDFINAQRAIDEKAATTLEKLKEVIADQK